MGIGDFESIFGEPKIEWASQNLQELRRFLFHVHTPGSSLLRILVTDFHSNTWEATKSVLQLEDMRDIIGIGGSLSEFIDYMISSLKSDDVKLLLKSHSDKDGITQAKLVAQKAKGMPLISIILTKLQDSAACEAMAKISFALFDAFKSMQFSQMKEQERCFQYAKVISDGKEKNDTNEGQLEQYSKMKKLREMDGSDKGDGTSSLFSSTVQNSPNKVAAGSTKMTKRAVPAHRRSKVRGVLLQDTEDDKNTMD